MQLRPKCLRVLPVASQSKSKSISFMQGICAYIPETNHVPKQYNVAAILSLLFMVPISLAAALALMYFYISTFQNMCAVPNVAVFCSSLNSWFPGMVLTYFLNDYEMVPFAPSITGYYYYYYYYYCCCCCYFNSSIISCMCWRKLW
jgi:hypothetical protein